MPARTRHLNGRRLLLLIAAGAMLAACGRDEEIDSGGSGMIRFSVLSPEPAPALSRAWAPVIADMEASTGLKVKPEFSNNDKALIEALRDRRTDLGRFSNPSGLEAVRLANGEVFARTFDSPGAVPDASILIVSAKSKLTLERILKCDRTLTLAMGEGLSTSTTLAAETYLFAARVVRPVAQFPGRHGGRGAQANLAAVAAGYGCRHQQHAHPGPRSPGRTRRSGAGYLDVAHLAPGSDCLA